MKGRNAHAMSNASTPDELGFKFRVPFACECVGIVMGGGVTDGVAGIEDGAGNPVSTPVGALWEADVGNTGARSFYFEHAAVSLAANTDYYMVWKPGGTSLTNYSWDVEDAAARAGLPWGVTSSFNTRTDGGSWTEDTTKTMIASLIISGIDNGAGGGGGSCNYGALSNGTRVVPVAQ
jgi:hypothetical protein